ncbi:uncharacterized protein ACA1_352150, partial [Acanthamoeba castellanii str. Neff]
MRWALWMMNSPPRTRETDTSCLVALTKATNVDASTDGGESKQIADWRLLLGRLLACLTRKATNLYLAVCAWLSIKEVGLLL